VFEGSNAAPLQRGLLHTNHNATGILSVKLSTQNVMFNY